MKKAEKDLMNKSILKHGEMLKMYFHLEPHVDPVGLSKKLLRIENQAHRACEDLCNGDIELAEFDKIELSALKRIQKLLGTLKDIFINQDARGYSLKIKDPTSFYYKDWGGNGILAPDFRC